MTTDAALGAMIEEALNDMDDTELLSVINSMSDADIATVLAQVPEHKGGVYSLNVFQWEEIASKLQGKANA